MKGLLHKAVSFCMVSALSFAVSIPALAAAPYREFKEVIQSVEYDGTPVQLEVYIPKYIGSFTTKLPVMVDGEIQDEELKVAVVRSNPVTGYKFWDLKGDELKEKSRNSIIAAVREYPDGQTIDTYKTDGYSKGNFGGYLWNEGPQYFSTEADMDSIFLVPSEDDLTIFLEEGSGGYIDVFFASGIKGGTGFNAILPLSEEKEASFLATGKINNNNEYNEWEDHVDLSGLKDVLLNQSSISITGTAVQNAAPLNAKASTSYINVNSMPVPFEAYNIDGSNYFKLRDVAAALNRTAKQFDVSYNQEKNAIELNIGKAYTLAGGELKLGDNTDKHAEKTNPVILLNNQEISLTSYNIDGNNYYKIRDLAEKIGFSVTWSEKNNAIDIKTN